MKSAIETLDRDVSQTACRPPIGPRLALAATLLGMIAAFVLAQSSLPIDAVLPAMVLLLFLVAGIAAVMAWSDASRLPPGHLTYRDVSGVLTFVGILLAAAVEPDQLVRLVASTSPSE